MIDFPANPTEGTKFTTPAGKEYIFSNGLWTVLAGRVATAAINDNAPSNPKVGDLWFNSATGELAVWYNDGNSSQWVSISILPKQDTADCIGGIMWFAMNAAPRGFLECDGATISRTTYSKLFTVISTTFGAGDGSTTFKLPDLRGEFVRGWDHGKGTDTGRTFGSSQADDLKSHKHNDLFVDVTKLKWGIQVLTGVGTAILDLTGTGSNVVSTGSTGGTETRPRNIALLPCIRYQ